MSEIEEISRAITRSAEAIQCTTEADNLLLTAHKQVADYTLKKAKQIFNRAVALDSWTRSFTKDYVAKCEDDAKPHYDRAESGMIAVRKITKDFNWLAHEFKTSKDLSRQSRILKMMKAKNWELKQCEKLLDLADAAAQEENRKLAVIEPIISKAYNSANENIMRCSSLSNFSVFATIQKITLEIGPIILALTITLFVDSMTEPLEKILKRFDATEYHNLAVLTLFALQWFLFDKLKGWLQHALQKRLIRTINDKFMRAVQEIAEVEADLTTAEEVCRSLTNRIGTRH